MIEYERVGTAPEKCKKDEYVINRPTFIEEIRNAKGRSGDKGLTTLGRLRNIFVEIGNKYSEAFSAYSNINLSNFVGLPFKDEKELSKIVCKIVDLQIPDAVDKLIEDQLKTMPNGVNKIYFVADDLQNTSAFGRHHIRMVEPKKTDKKTKSKDKK